MKNTLFLILAVLFFCSTSSISQTESDSTGFAGDHFSLEGALELFKQSKSPEDFEKRLNKESNFVNNLDLNEDGEIDYIKVYDNAENEAHAIVLQVDINKEESQDVAVILIEKTGDEKAILQIIGDEDVYGEEKIMEPSGEAINSGGKGSYDLSFVSSAIVVNVWMWPSVRFIYTPGYKVYRSPWRYHYYPKWWSPWKPHPWRWHYTKRSVYHVHSRPFHTHRVHKAHNFYKPRRSSSVTVRTKTTHTRTVVKSNKKGKSVTVKSKTKTKTKTTGKRGKSKTSTTKTKTKKSAGVKKDKKGNKKTKVKSKKTKSTKTRKKGK